MSGELSGRQSRAKEDRTSNQLQNLQGIKDRKTTRVQNRVEYLEKLNVCGWNLAERKKEYIENF